jgi:hypothetical protein
MRSIWEQDFFDHIALLVQTQESISWSKLAVPAPAIMYELHLAKREIQSRKHMLIPYKVSKV